MLREQFLYDLRVVGRADQPMLQSLVPELELVRVEAEQVQDSRLQVADVDFVSDGEETQLVDLLREANYQLTEAIGIAPHHKGHAEAERYARRCLEGSQALVSTLER